MVGEIAREGRSQRSIMETKQCSKCHETRQITTFDYRYDRNSIHRVRRGVCRHCRHKVLKNRVKLNEQITLFYETKPKDLNTSKHRKKLKAIKFLGGECKLCGETDIVTFDFHHINPKQKRYEINRMWTQSWGSIKREIAKCALLCANCHRKVEAYNLPIS